MAKAVHDRAQMRGWGDPVLQGREGRRHALHRQRPVQAGRIRHRAAGRRHRRRTRHAVALEHAHPDAGMHRSRSHPQRQLHQGRGTLRAESGIRLLLPPSRQRPVVSDPPSAGPAPGAPGGVAPRRADSRVRAGSASVSGVLSSLRYLLSDFIGEDDEDEPFLPQGLPDSAAPIVSEAIHRLIDYQGAAYAQLYVDRLRRFVGKRGVDDAMFGEIARLMAVRMSYEDPIRIAQLKLAELETDTGAPRRPSADDVRKFRLDELVDVVPAVVAEAVLDALQWAGWVHKAVSIRFRSASWGGIRRLKIEASLRRWRRFSVRYAKERLWVERWLHMIDRSLTKQPAAASAMVQTATMVQGYGDTYRQGLADWHAIIDGLAKPTFDGVLPLRDLAGAVAEARAAAMPDPRQAALKRVIAEIRARALSSGTNAA